MARHSHWHQIRRSKGAEDAKRGKIFTRHAKLISLASSKGGGDPNTNSYLRMAIENARVDNMPKDNIDRAIKKGTGESKDGVKFSEVTYEGFGPGGVSVIVQAVTDNSNRTLQSVRKTFIDHGGNLGAPGSSAYLFETRGIIRVFGKDSKEADELALIDAGAEDLESTEVDNNRHEFFISVQPQKLSEARGNIEKAGFSVISAELSLEPKTRIKMKDKNIAGKIIQLLEALEDNEDVSKVSTNADF